MRRLSSLLLGLAGCGSSAPAPATAPTTAPAPAGITVHPDVTEALQSGFAVPIELVESDGSVATTCTITFDLWDEVYVVERRHAVSGRSADMPRALGYCLSVEPTEVLTARLASDSRPDPLKKRPAAVF